LACSGPDLYVGAEVVAVDTFNFPESLGVKVIDYADDIALFAESIEVLFISRYKVGSYKGSSHNCGSNYSIQYTLVSTIYSLE